jgi:threonine dehydratase
MKSHIHTPLVEYFIDPRIFLKPENLQPFGSYKIRGVQHFFKQRLVHLQEKGLVVASAGNMGQAAAYFAKEYNIDCTIFIPESTPTKKKQILRLLQANVVEKSFHEIWDMVCMGYRGREIFLHPALCEELTDGYASIVGEILSDAKNIDAIVVPFGVGGLMTGILAAIENLKPNIKIYAAEIDTAAPLSLSLEKGHACKIDRRPSFVDAIGTPHVLPKVFEKLRGKVSGSILVSEKEAAECVYTIIAHHSMIIEGAAAVTLAAAERLVRSSDCKKVVAILSGGNIDVKIQLQTKSVF